MRQQHDEIAAHGAVVLVIGFEAARRVGGFCRRHTLPFRCLVDERRTVYAAYGMGRTVSTRIAGPVLLTGVVLALGWPGWALLAVAFVLMSLLISTKAVRDQFVAARTAGRSG